LINKLRQFFCRHKNADWYKKESLFVAISGETLYYVCNDCGKELDKRFLEYEGNGFR
jgi:hypothetical protein